MKTVDPGDLIEAGDLVQTFVQSGASPTEAVVKAAKEYGLGPGAAGVLCTAYNRSAQLSQNDAGDMLSKLADFDLADPDAVFLALHEGRPTKAASSEPERYPVPVFRRTPTRGEELFEKAAAECDAPATRVRTPVEKRAAVQIARNELEMAETANDIACERLLTIAVTLRSKYASEDPATAGLAYWAVRRYPDKAPAFLKMAGATSDGSKVPVLRVGIDERSAPFELFKEAMELTDRAIEVAEIRELKKKALHLAEREENGNAFDKRVKLAWAKIPAVDPSRMSLFDRLAEADAVKEAAAYWDSPQGRAEALALADRELERSMSKAAVGPLASPVVTLPVGTALAKGVGFGEISPANVGGWVDKLDDPDHDERLRQIRVRSMLTQMMSDPDDPLSGYDPADVVEQYNEIARLTPRIAEHAPTLRALLRRRMSGNTETFENKELLDSEKTMMQIESNRGGGAE